ncbi:hypothetical protein EDB81DRAFT_408909 [Dactylonectria macrodidyma]|uniref:DUF1168-domain-containing protein n=1 Tax=Dactylonectria macrodidyma TaxID=307937 RepID=A0A9P9JAL2_9HYPO|nr:hypothetical protein EDB81DRAFT_408909 [Dactylonectria macrodidyma]
MSAPGPESIPTSADPRSHRPTKKRALTPVSSQAANVDALFAKPDQHIRVPDSSAGALLGPGRAAPPEIVTNVQGSSAGAGSGEFHVYKASRRREYDRLREMDDDLRRDKDQIQFEKEKTERERKDEERTRKNREKREKMKARKANKGKGPAPAANKKASASSPTCDGEQLGSGTGENAKERDTAPTNHKSKEGDQKPASAVIAEPAGLVIHDDED